MLEHARDSKLVVTLVQAIELGAGAPCLRQPDPCWLTVAVGIVCDHVWGAAAPAD